MTNQELVNITCEHLIKQNRKCVVTTIKERNLVIKNRGYANIITCLYRKEQKNGQTLTCAAGYHIPKEEYSPSIEGLCIDSIDYFVNNFTDNQLDLLGDLQYIHDDMEPTEWPKELSSVCKKFGLDVPNCVREQLSVST